MMNLFVNVLLLVSIFTHPIFCGTFVVNYENHVFLKDGKPFRYISGSFPYFRLHPDYWEDRFQRIRALGLNAIQTYTAWNLHEPIEGTYDFSSPGLNISIFFDLSAKYNLSVLLRPGPYIDAEWEQGGLPYWLLKHDGIKMRTSDKNYTNAVAKYYDKLLDVIYPFLYKNGGPIIMVQIENEYGNLAACDRNYTTWLRDLIWSKLGNDVVLYTTDPIGSLPCGTVPDTLTTIDFQPPDNVDDIKGYFEAQDSYSHGAPHVCSEFYNSWFVTWGQKSSTPDNFESVQKYVNSILNMYHNSSASFNLYMAYGGYNTAFYNSANREAPYITQYWVGSPIADNGDVTDMYLGIYNFMKNLTDWEQKPLPIPTNIPTTNYGPITLTRVGSSLIFTLSRMLEQCTSSVNPLTFEEIDHPYGYVIYSTTISQGGSLLRVHNLKDYGYVFVNNVYQDSIMRDISQSMELNIKAQPGDVLKILVENRGRTCISEGLPYAIPDRKGLFENVTLDNNPLRNWAQCGVNLTKESIDSLTSSFDKNPSNYEPSEATSFSPGVYIGQFEADVIEDTYFNSSGWDKGQLFINGYNIGRYWASAGPQMTLYIPKPYLQKKNSVVLIELLGARQNHVNFIDHHIYDFKN